MPEQQYNTKHWQTVQYQTLANREYERENHPDFANM